IRDKAGPQTWDQSHVRLGSNNSGFWPVEIAGDGIYQFDVQRWPKELNHPISASLPPTENGDIDSQGRPVQPGKGKAIPAERVELVVGTTKMEATIGDSNANARFDVELYAGPTDVRAWLIDSKGSKRGADVCSVGHASGKQGSASRRTERVNVKVGESHAFGVQNIEVGCFYDGIAMAGQIAIPLVICHN
ncbi:unnamed protein product, partial [marine sediment metagenome]